MFGPSYDGALPTERIKYGCLNTTGDSYRGVDSAAGYGDSYLILKSEVRRRCTFTECDSAFSLCAVGVADAYAHVLVKFVDASSTARRWVTRGFSWITSVNSATSG